MLITPFIFVCLWIMVQNSDSDIGHTITDFKTGVIVLNHAETIQNHRKSLKYLEKYMFPLQKTLKLPNGVSATCNFGLRPTNVTSRSN